MFGRKVGVSIRRMLLKSQKKLLPLTYLFLCIITVTARCSPESDLQSEFKVDVKRTIDCLLITAIHRCQEECLARLTTSQAPRSMRSEPLKSLFIFQKHPSRKSNCGTPYLVSQIHFRTVVLSYLLIDRFSVCEMQRIHFPCQILFFFFEHCPLIMHVNLLFAKKVLQPCRYIFPLAFFLFFPHGRNARPEIWSVRGRRG